jgi:hypothetical protein
MNFLPQPDFRLRSPRLHPAPAIPAVLRFPDGHCASAMLDTISLTGGLCSIQKPLDRGARVRMMFVTQLGAVLGTAEMLTPVTWGMQPFRFTALAEKDQRRLGQAIRTSLGSEGTVKMSAASSVVVNPPVRILPREEEWIAKYRAALDGGRPSRWRIVKLLLAAAVTLSAASAIGMFVLQRFR